MCKKTKQNTKEKTNQQTKLFLLECDLLYSHVADFAFFRTSLDGSKQWAGSVFASLIVNILVPFWSKLTTCTDYACAYWLCVLATRETGVVATKRRKRRENRTSGRVSVRMTCEAWDLVGLTPLLLSSLSGESGYVRLFTSSVWHHHLQAG